MHEPYDLSDPLKDKKVGRSKKGQWQQAPPAAVQPELSTKNIQRGKKGHENQNQQVRRQQPLHKSPGRSPGRKAEGNLKSLSK